MNSNSENSSVAEASTIDEELVAYLDGELDAENEARVVRRLAEDAGYRARLVQLQRAWDMLDTLQRSEADDELVHSTVAMVAVQAAEEAKTQKVRIVRRRTMAWLAVVMLVAVSAATAYAVIQQRLSRPNRELVRDLPVIERVDEYRNIGNVEFLKQLQRENLFAAEVDHEM
jgi:anti-sigma factor RsiW